MSKKKIAEVENKYIIPLLKKLSLITSDDMYSMRVPVKIRQGRETQNKEADIVLKNKEGKNFVVVEAKNTKESIDDDAIGQLDSYCFFLSCPYGIACNGKDFVVRAYLAGNEKRYIVKTTIDKVKKEHLSSIIDGKKIERESEISATVISEQSENFSELLKNIHQIIRDTDKLDPTAAFDGWSRLLFMKIYEEQWTKDNSGKVRFNYSEFKKQRELQKGESYIKDTFETTCKEYPNIFKKEEEIGLSLEAIDKILKKLDGYKIQEIPIDVKGKAYETFLSSTFRGKGLGQYFTPRQVVDFMSNWVNITLRTKMLDPACGTGGFLIKTFQRMRELVSEAPDTYLSQYNTTREKMLKNIKDNQIFGIDGEPRATKTAKMNMIMWGDGENVVRGNGLDNKDINGVGDINLILANPPFGAKEKDENIIGNYNLYKNRKIQKTECLFLERALKTLAPEGELCIVIPDSILGSDSMKEVRSLITDYSKIIGVVSLPQHTFTPSGVQTINSSILYLKKYREEFFKEIESSSLSEDKDFKNQLKKKYGYDNYCVFMAIAKEIGYEPNGKPTKSLKNDLNLILADYKVAKQNEFFVNEEYHKISDNSFTISFNKITKRC